MRKLSITAAITLLITSSFAIADSPKPTKIVTYKTVGDVELKLHIFNPKGHKSTDKAPAVVFFFGGAWVHGSAGQFYKQSAYLASRGMVAACAEYRIKKKHNTTPKECVMDGKSVLRWMRKNAKKLGIDPDKIAAGGGSAGGHVAAALGTVKGFNEKGEDTSVSCVPNALLLFNPVFDNGPDGGWGQNRVKEYWKEISPKHNISSSTPPTIVFLGREDSIIPVATAERYQKTMKDAGVRCDLHLYDGEGHGFFNGRKFKETMIESDKFLKSLGFLKGDPTL